MGEEMNLVPQENALGGFEVVGFWFGYSKIWERLNAETHVISGVRTSLYWKLMKPWVVVDVHLWEYCFLGQYKAH